MIMKFKIILAVLMAAIVFNGCKKDLGNYNYSAPSEPVLDNFSNGTVNALVGDSLIINPYVFLAGANPATDLSYQWDISVDEEARTAVYTGYPLKIVYNLAPKLRPAKLTITDNRNGIKYFYAFKINGGTQFSEGKVVLSVQNNITKLSFIKPDDKTILSDLYFALHGENLPANPLQLFAKPLAYQPGTAEDYWIICNDPAKNSVVINGNTMLRKHYFNDQFFSPPPVITPGSFEASNGIPTGMINDKLYISIWTTAPFAPDFGKFSNPQTGSYSLSKFYTKTPNFYFGYDTKAKAFISFDGGGNYMGTDYAVVGNNFNPQHIDLGDLIFMHVVSGTSYAFFKGSDGTGIYELSFGVAMDDYNTRTIKPIYKRVFKGASLIQPDTKWVRSAVDVFYFTSNDKIYRYNPVNEDLRPLDANFSEKKVTMLQLSDDGNTITTGVDGSVITLDVSVGKNGVITKTINGIPGAPVDIVIKKFN
jgi:hypothetical protein